MATIDARGPPVADVTPAEFSLFCQSQDGAWCLIKTKDTDAQSFVFNWLLTELDIPPVEAAVSIRDFYLATIGGKKIPSRAILSQTLQHMSHVQVIERRRGGMNENVPIHSIDLPIHSTDLPIHSIDLPIPQPQITKVAMLEAQIQQVDELIADAEQNIKTWRFEKKS
jgi:hypothetical protein